MHVSSLNFELEFDLNNPYLLTKEEVIDMFDEGDDATDNDPIQESWQCANG